MDLIIGAGVTGLSYAAFCGHDDYLILESDSLVGGYCKTTSRNGYIWDYSGHFFHFMDEGIKDFVMNKMNKSDLLEIVKDTSIKYKDILVDYPFQKNIHQLSKEELIDCLFDLFNISNNDYNNFKEMLYVKFGKSIADKFLIPYNSKLYACDLNTLDKDAMGRFFPYAEKEDIIKNFKSDGNDSYNSTFVYPKTGAIAYVNSILNHVDTNKIKTDCKVINIDTYNRTVTTNSGAIIKFDKLISTIPFPKLLEICNVNYNKDIYNWNKVLVFNLGFDTKGNNEKTHWLYFPEDKYCFYRVGYYSNILSSDRMSLYVEIGFGKDDVINQDEWLERVLNDLKKAGIVDDKQILVDYESILMNPAYVHINSNALIDVKEQKKKLSQFDIYSIGRYGSWTYCSIEDNIKESKFLAKLLNQ